MGSEYKRVVYHIPHPFLVSKDWVRVEIMPFYLLLIKM